MKKVHADNEKRVHADNEKRVHADFRGLSAEFRGF
jgi:hypothetical protein